MPGKIVARNARGDKTVVKFGIVWASIVYGTIVLLHGHSAYMLMAVAVVAAIVVTPIVEGI